MDQEQPTPGPDLPMGVNPHRTHAEIHETEWGTFELSKVSGGLSTYLGTYATRAAAMLAYAARGTL